MKSNVKNPTGVLHHKLSAKRYRLRRYFPDAPLIELIEQFWLVSWDLRDEKKHTQKNLPDPNFHLILDNRKLKLIGPISKAYSYKMEGVGRIIGIKFALGALSDFLESPLSNYVDKELDFQQLVDFDLSTFISELDELQDDEKIVELLQTYMTSFVITPSSELIRVRELVNRIKNDSDITRVEHLSKKTNLSIRTIQRCFKYHLGLSPKWLIRKYRLHQALELIEKSDVKFLDIVELLGYTDQSHLIRDFNEIIGVTPKNYINQSY